MGSLFIGLIVGLAIGVVALYLYMPKVAMKKIDSFLTGLMSSSETIREFLSRNLTATEFERLINELKRNLSAQIYIRISERSVSDGAAHLLVAQVSTRLSSNQVESEQRQGFFGRKMDALKNVVMGHAENIIENNKEFIEKTLSDKINDVITKNGEEIIADLVNKEIDNILSRPVSSLFQGNEKVITELKQNLSNNLLGKR